MSYLLLVRGSTRRFRLAKGTLASRAHAARHHRAPAAWRTCAGATPAGVPVDGEGVGFDTDRVVVTSASLGRRRGHLVAIVAARTPWRSGLETGRHARHGATSCPPNDRCALPEDGSEPRRSGTPQRRLWLAAGLLLLTALVASCNGRAPSTSPHGRDQAHVPPCAVDARAEVGSDVALRIQVDGQAHVMITLRVPAAEGQTEDERRAAIGRVQEGVLAALDETDYSNRVQYRTLPALAGTIRTCRGLEILSKHPDVRRIDLDIGGGGH